MGGVSFSGVGMVDYQACNWDLVCMYFIATFSG